MLTSPKSYYTERLSALELESKQIRKGLSTLFWGRSLAFLLVATFIVLFIVGSHNKIYLAVSFLCFLLFLVAIKLDLKLAHKEKVLSNRILIIKGELEFLNHQYKHRNSGQKYMPFNLHLAADFDLFGQGSLFQYLNRCSSKMGTQRFAKALCQFEHNPMVILERQEAIQELSTKPLFVEEFQTYGLFVHDHGDELLRLKAWLDAPLERSRFIQPIALAFPIVSVLWIALVAFGVFAWSSIFILFILGTFLGSHYGKVISKAYAQLDKSAKSFEKFAALITIIENQEFKAPFLVKLRGHLFNSDSRASRSIASLFKLLNLLDLRGSIVFTGFINPFTLLDVNVYVRLMKWKAVHKQNAAVWFDSLSEMDALMGYATYAFNNEGQVTYPEVVSGAFVFESIDMGHPLLHPEVRIDNSIEFKGPPSVIIVTGANMAGKSTFLRTLAVNLILGMKGAPVCAKRFLFSPCDILSSIKIQDSLSNNESYFYAELLRIRDIIDHVTVQPQTLVVLDEILRGTNTKDKQQGSLGLLEKLISLNAHVLVATHDLVIGELENTYPAIVSNRCFEVELTNDQLIFDYKLKRGISQKLNASFLMKKMGIID